ncbi:CPBP family intramembrane glutamic endopeptidase [Planktothrix mougeotii]|uniref:CPBP family intramembrane metalloprotease n=1 Tax=Planktothrix mougeotii LEGE 06226 TaxID=1828728 RepID=A0ABR9U5V1_9CYAN|nr:CPBP family intramembrane glutamic endopeptidase [Planktothrix mougeotii]MBE9141818.1 CPBP family intramembrane metalloprotease [Planktothrix mougeotii LEGE 06226]
MTSSKKLFIVLEFAGLVGVLSLLATPPLLIEGAELPLPVETLQLLSLIQPFILLSIAVFVGVKLAHKVNLFAPGFEAIASGNSPFLPLKPQIIPGLIGGLITGLTLPFIFQLAKPFLPEDFLKNATQFSPNLSILTRLFYGGITEEILLRWGLMTMLVWIAWRFFQQRRGTPHNFAVGLAIVLSSILFGFAHLPIAFLLTKQPNLALLIYIIGANSFFGLIAGYLYWKKGLESAMIAHVFSHVIMVIMS